MQSPAFAWTVIGLAHRPYCSERTSSGAIGFLGGKGRMCPAMMPVAPRQRKYRLREMIANKLAEKARRSG